MAKLRLHHPAALIMFLLLAIALPGQGKEKTHASDGQVLSSCPADFPVKIMEGTKTDEITRKVLGTWTRVRVKCSTNLDSEAVALYYQKALREVERYKRRRVSLYRVEKIAKTQTPSDWHRMVTMTHPSVERFTVTTRIDKGKVTYIIDWFTRTNADAGSWTTPGSMGTG